VLSPLANLLALPAVPVAMAASLPLAATPFLPDALLAPVGWLAWVPLAWIIAVVEACAAPSWASLPVGPVPVGLAWAWYAAWAAILLILSARSYRFSLPSPRSVFDRTPAGWVVGIAALAAVAAWAGALSVPDAAPRLTVFESSGATLLRTTQSRWVLIDPGDNGGALTADIGRTLPFWASEIDLVVVPRDEAGALADLLRRHTIRQVVALAPSGAAHWRDVVRAAGVPVAIPPDGTVVDLGEGARMELVLTSEGYATGLTAAQHRLLHLADAAVAHQRAVADLLDAPVDTLILGSGAAGPLDPLLRERANPRFLIAHVPRGPPRPLPRPDERLSVLRSDDHGTVELIFRPSGLEVRSRR